MSGPSQPSTQVVTQSIDPAMQPYIAYGLSEAQKLYQDPSLPGYYPGQGYISPSEATQQSLQFAANRAVQGNPLLQQSQQTVGQLQGAVNPAMAGYQNMYANAPSDPSAGFYQAMQGGQFQNAALPGTMQTAQGAYLGGSPFFSGAFDAAARSAGSKFQDQIQSVSSQTSRAGRYGSNAMGQLQDRASGQFAQSLTDTASNLAYQNYAAERQMQEAAQGRLGSLSQQDVLNRMAGAQGLSAGTQQQYANQMAALGGLGSTAASDYARQLQAAGMAPGMAAADYADIDRLYQTGQVQESYQQAALADEMQRFNFMQNLPASKLQSFLSAAYGAPMGQQTTQPIYRNQAANIFGGAALGGALGGSQYGSLGSAIGAGAGLFGLLGP